MGEHQAENLSEARRRRGPRIPLGALFSGMVVGLLVSACAPDGPAVAKHAMVIGHVDLPANATPLPADLRVRLKDPDLEGRILGESTIKNVSAGHIPFVIRYDPHQVTADRSYAVEVAVAGQDGGRLETVVPIEVDPYDQQDVEIAFGSAPPRPFFAGVEAGPRGVGDEPAGSEVIVLPARAPSASRRCLAEEPRGNNGTPCINP